VCSLLLAAACTANTIQVVKADHNVLLRRSACQKQREALCNGCAAPQYGEGIIWVSGFKGATRAMPETVQNQPLHLADNGKADSWVLQRR
jgi:hypothetical protein